MQNANAPDLIRHLLEHRDGLFGFVLALTHDREAAEEIFQELGLAVVQEAQKGVDVRSFLPWAHEIARRRAAEHFRRRGRSPQRLDSLEESVALAFQENAADPGQLSQRQEHLAGCIEDLPPTSRDMIERRYRGRDSIRGIARGLSWTENAVKVALWKARQRLAECISFKMGGGR
jgi:RNA polymerase sigma-70 factor, ECF subfamily